MLILYRRPGESFEMSHDGLRIGVVVLSIEHHQSQGRPHSVVKLGIEAPPEVLILRDELLPIEEQRAIQAEAHRQRFDDTGYRASNTRGWERNGR